MAAYLAIGDTSKPGSRTETLFINLDEICRVKWVNPVSGTDSDDQTIEVTFTDAKVLKFGAEIARIVCDYVTDLCLEPKRKPKGKVFKGKGGTSVGHPGLDL